MFCFDHDSVVACCWNKLMDLLIGCRMLGHHGFVFEWPWFRWVCMFGAEWHVQKRILETITSTHSTSKPALRFWTEVTTFGNDTIHHNTVLRVIMSLPTDCGRRMKRMSEREALKANPHRGVLFQDPFYGALWGAYTARCPSFLGPHRPYRMSQTQRSQARPVNDRINGLGTTSP